MTSVSAVTAIRGALVTFSGDPFVEGVAATRHHEADAIVAMAGGRIVDCGPAREVSARLPAGTPVVAYANALITAGFVDGHVHYPQVPVIGAGGKSLLDWLADYTFPTERRFADAKYAREVAKAYLAENLRHGITTAAVYRHCSSGLRRRVLRRSASAWNKDDRGQGADGPACAAGSRGHGAARL